MIIYGSLTLVILALVINYDARRMYRKATKMFNDSVEANEMATRIYKKIAEAEQRKASLGSDFYHNGL